MGEVYRAKDTRLGRDVAIKVLPSHLSSSAEVRQRFEREAKTISQLSHPHICALYDVGREGKTEYLVMEYLEGETLSDRLAKGALPLEQTLRYGVEIADALDKAHRQGIVHRDLKPGNVMLTKSGVKLLDFGLAKAMAPASSQNGLTALPTQAHLTQEGTILGTFQYMAPEQLEGKEADARADIFAFGAVLYEMATGKKAFSGSTQASLISAILRDEPQPISQAQPMSPPALDRVVKTCLAKDPEIRWQSVHDVALELDAVSELGRETSPSVSSGRGRLERLFLRALALGLLAALIFALFRPRPAARARTVRFNLDLPANLSLLPGGGLSVSPDGRQIVFSAANLSGHWQLYVRALDSLDQKALPGTEEATDPFWSADGRQIGFFAGGKLKSIDLAGGRAVELADQGPAGPGGGTWTSDGSIVVGHYRAGLERLASGGGTLTPFLALDASRGETSQRWPHLLPDGKHLVFLSTSKKPKASSIEVIDTDGTSRRALVKANSEAWVAGGFLVYARDGVLLAQRIDTRRLALSAAPVVVQDPVAYRSLFGTMAAAVSEDVLAYCTSVVPTTRLLWLDRFGKELSAAGFPGPFSHLDLAPDGTRVALERTDPHTGLGEIWIGDLSRDTFTRVTSSTDWNWKPLWSPDGSRLVFSSTRSNVSDLYLKSKGGAGSDELLLADPSSRLGPEDWSRDGRLLVFQKLVKTGTDLWALPLTGEKKAAPLVTGGGPNNQASLSPDGRFLAYTSREGERPEVVVVPVPPSGEKWQISTHGGVMARWRTDGRELFYIAPDRELMAVPVTPGAAFRAGLPQRLFTVRVLDLNSNRRWYAPSQDGARFLILAAVDEQPPPITVVTGWALERNK